ncbi:MAG: hypothetical protein ACOY99_00690 [Pseudomonadota bacterium]
MGAFINRLKALAHDRAGTGVAELALMAPLLALMMVALVDVSLGLGFKLKLQRTAKAASELALVKRPVNNDVSYIEDAARQAYQSPTLMAQAALQCECPDGTAVACGDPCPGGARRQTYLAVDVSDAYRPLLGYFGLPAITVSGRAVLRLQ